MSDYDTDNSFHSISSDDEGNEEFNYSIPFNSSLLEEATQKTATSNFTIYLFPNSRNFIEKILPWTYNNPLNTEHINSIKIQLKQNPILTGVFTIVHLDNERIYLLDGHHRHQALLKLYQEGELDEPIEIVVHCYRSDTINSRRTINLFQNLNHTKPFHIENKVTETTIMVINFMEKTYPGIVKDSPIRATFPFIHKKTLNEVLFRRLESLEDFNYESIIHSIPDINRYYEINAMKIVKKNKKNWDKVSKKLERTGCYLGLSPMNKWIEEITQNVEYQ